MAGGLGVRNPHVHPPLTRSRSHTLPSSTRPIDEGPDQESGSRTDRPVRPSYVRSRSYLSPGESKTGSAQPVPVEKTSTTGLHIPAASKHSGVEARKHRHRYTQSQNETQHRSRHSENENLPHLVAGLAAEREKRHQLERLGTNASDLWHMRANDLRRMASHRAAAGQGNLRDNQRLRATSDPRSPLTPLPVRKTSTEILLDRAEARKVANRAAMTEKDVEKMKHEQEVADSELRDRLAEIANLSHETNRRLEYAYYNLLEKVGNLVGTIQTFQNLSTQSQHLLRNFETETAKLDEDIRRRVKRFRADFDGREERVADLEDRGRKASLKAKELGTRLENARVMVQNWEKREAAVKQKWGRVWGFVWWTFIITSVTILAIIVGKEWWFRGDPVAAALSLPPEGSRNKSLGLNRESLETVKVPPDVRKVLADIEERRRTKKIWPALPKVATCPPEEARDEDDDHRLRLLDEL